MIDEEREEHISDLVDALMDHGYFIRADDDEDNDEIVISGLGIEVVSLLMSMLTPEQMMGIIARALKSHAELISSGHGRMFENPPQDDSKNWTPGGNVLDALS